MSAYCIVTSYITDEQYAMVLVLNSQTFTSVKHSSDIQMWLLIYILTVHQIICLMIKMFDLIAQLESISTLGTDGSWRYLFFWGCTSANIPTYDLLLCSWGVFGLMQLAAVNVPAGQSSLNRHFSSSLHFWPVTSQPRSFFRYTQWQQDQRKP